MRAKKKVLLILTILMLISVFCSCSVQKSSDTAVDDNDFKGKKVGIQTGVAYDSVAAEYLPGCEIAYYNSASDLAFALEKGKIKSYLIDEPIARLLNKEYPSQRILKILKEESYAWVMPKANPKAEKLHAEVNEFFAKCRENGTLAEVDEIWFGTDKSKQKIDYNGLTAENGKLSLALCSTVGAPFCYIQDNTFAGYDPDLAVRFCREYGYGLEVTDYDVPGLFGCIASGKCDFSACCIAITEERKEAMLFSEPNYTGGIALVVSDGTATKNEKTDIFASIKESFYKTFIRENRYQLFASGLCTTLYIILMSLLLGTLLGFAVFLLYYRFGKRLRALVNVLMRIAENTPVVVILMILYYVIFGSFDISSVTISVIGFVLIFAGSVIGVVRVGVDAVDPGQREAALALGYTEKQTFIKVILPQAAIHFLPGYKSAIIQLIKGTAVVGYIAVQDITKVSDIIRSRTYEAFFPLIVTAILYYLILTDPDGYRGLSADEILNDIFYNTKVYINGERIARDCPIYEVNSSLCVPLRSVSESLDAYVGWDNGKIDIIRDNTHAIFYVDSDIANVNGRNVQLNNKVFLDNDVTYVPLRFVCEVFGNSVSWDSNRKAAYVN